MVENGRDRTRASATSISKVGTARGGRSLSTPYLNFLGRALVRLAHDLKNHMATMSESAGLMVDLLKMKKSQRWGWAGRLLKRHQGLSLDKARFFTHLNTIQEEIVQAAALIQQLGHFAHHMEEAQSIFEGNEALKEIRVLFLERAGKKGIHLDLRLCRTTSMIETDLIQFQMAVLFIVEKVIAGLDDGGQVVLESDAKEGVFQVCISSPSPGYSSRYASEEPEDEDFCRDLVEELGGRILEPSQEDKCSITLDFPLAKRKI